MCAHGITLVPAEETFDFHPVSIEAWKFFAANILRQNCPWTVAGLVAFLQRYHIVHLGIFFIILPNGLIVQ